MNLRLITKKHITLITVVIILYSLLYYLVGSLPFALRIKWEIDHWGKKNIEFNDLKFKLKPLYILYKQRGDKYLLIHYLRPEKSYFINLFRGDVYRNSPYAFSCEKFIQNCDYCYRSEENSFPIFYLSEKDVYIEIIQIGGEILSKEKLVPILNNFLDP